MASMVKVRHFFSPVEGPDPAGDTDGLGSVGEGEPGGNSGGFESAVVLRGRDRGRVAGNRPGWFARAGSLIWAYRLGWFFFTKRATDYDVSVPGCRARWWSRR
jgi:hypothetical protein